MSIMATVHSASYAMGITVSLLGVKQPGHKDDHSFPSSTEIKNEWSYNPAPPKCLHGMNRDKFTLQRTVTMESVLTDTRVEMLRFLGQSVCLWICSGQPFTDDLKCNK